MKLFRYDPHSLSGVYALDAIDDEIERDKFQRHLHRCQQCSSEVKGLAETATRLAYNVSRPPPVLMRDRVLTAVSQTRQLPPIVDKQARERPKRSSPWWRLWTGAPYVLAMASVVALIVILVGQASTERQLDRAKARVAALTAVLSAPDSRAKTQTTANGTRATVVYSLRDHALVFTSDGLPPLPSGKVYQLWLINKSRIRSAGLLKEGPADNSRPVLAEGLLPGDVVGLTVEPAGGTKQPTMNPFIVIKLSA
ncbi:MAG TPA: anti-sigma factor [Streptosporangiaceae bacterium]|nr:anti-sigma factor [Streptosporangiaceae bacterium]